jgi:hypothetical protein
MFALPILACVLRVYKDLSTFDQVHTCLNIFILQTLVSIKTFLKATENLAPLIYITIIHQPFSLALYNVSQKTLKVASRAKTSQLAEIVQELN